MHHATLAVAAGSSALMLAAAVVELPRRSAPTPVVLPIPKGDFARADPPFAERWVTPAPTTPRAEALPLPMPEEALPARTHQRAPVRHELCAAHGMRREYYRRGGWQYWRCRH